MPAQGGWDLLDRCEDEDDANFNAFRDHSHFSQKHSEELSGLINLNNDNSPRRYSDHDNMQRNATA
jgi:hypothetical protein